MDDLTSDQVIVLCNVDTSSPEGRDDLDEAYRETFDECIKLGYIREYKYYYLTHLGEGKLEDHWDKEAEEAYG